MNQAFKTAALRLVREALREDLGPSGDVTTRFFVPPAARISGRVVAKQEGTFCGGEVAALVFKAADARSRIRILVRDGGQVKPGRVLMTVRGGPKILTAERAALNFLQHLSGVATLTGAFAARVRGTRARIYDTRKTIPGLRSLEKYAVSRGGGVNHRFGLSDAALLKDNHWALCEKMDASVRRFRRAHPRLPLEMEAATLSQVRRALAAKVDIILLDNMGPASLKRSIALIRSHAPKTSVEISGGVSLGNVRALARLGPDRISIGRLTHSAPALNMSLEIP